MNIKIFNPHGYHTFDSTMTVNDKKKNNNKKK